MPNRAFICNRRSIIAHDTSPCFEETQYSFTGTERSVVHIYCSTMKNVPTLKQIEGT